jgi:hypothetical protein
LEKKMEMQSAEIKELATALAKAQADIKPAVKSSDNPFFKSKYADLAAVVEACKDALSKNGFSYVQSIQGDTLVTTLLHSSGQWMRSVAAIKPVKSDPQSFGSAVTYMRRYSLAAIVGVCTEDDDGNAASGSDVKNAKSGNDVKAAKAMSMALDREQWDQVYDQILEKLDAADTIDVLETVWKSYSTKLKGCPEDLKTDLILKAGQYKQDMLGKQQLNGAHIHG